ncbi:alpha/beta fold hydrolase [Candidatus Poribacteria bacterium]|nr:alpha/beta fold hydrolase [Candidatus Poribacteria bacterium]
MFGVFLALYLYQPPADNSYASRYLKENPTRFLQLGDYKIHYLVRGSGAPVILVHGGGTWLYSFRNNIPSLSEHFTVYALDMPGHGYTEYLGEPAFDLDTFAEVLDGFMMAMNLSSAALVGNSWGGGWALYFAEKHPEKVRGLVLIDSSGFVGRDHWEWEILKYPLLGEVLSKFVSRSWVEDSYRKDVFHDAGKVTDEIVSEVYKPLTFPRNRRAQYKIERGLDWKLTEAAMGSIKAPTLIIWGKQDKYVDVRSAERFRQNIRNSTVVVLDNCGHTPHEECPAAVNELIVEFVGGSKSASTGARNMTN